MALPHVVAAISGESVPSVHVVVSPPTKVNPELQVNVTTEPEEIVPISGERSPLVGASTFVQSAAAVKHNANEMLLLCIFIYCKHDAIFVNVLYVYFVINGSDGSCD